MRLPESGEICCCNRQNLEQKIDLPTVHTKVTGVPLVALKQNFKVKHVVGPTQSLPCWFERLLA